MHKCLIFCCLCGVKSVNNGLNGDTNMLAGSARCLAFQHQAVPVENRYIDCSSPQRALWVIWFNKKIILLFSQSGVWKPWRYTFTDTRAPWRLIKWLLLVVHAFQAMCIPRAEEEASILIAKSCSRSCGHSYCLHQFLLEVLCLFQTEQDVHLPW